MFFSFIAGIIMLPSVGDQVRLQAAVILGIIIRTFY
jgi:hypothetical protein